MLTVVMQLDGRELQWYGKVSVFQYEPTVPANLSRFPAIVEDASRCYVLMVDGVDESSYNPDFDWSRHLPAEVILDRREHDKSVRFSLSLGLTRPHLPPSQAPGPPLQILHIVVSANRARAVLARHVPRAPSARVADAAQDDALLAHAAQRPRGVGHGVFRRSPDTGSQDATTLPRESQGLHGRRVP